MNTRRIALLLSIAAILIEWSAQISAHIPLAGEILRPSPVSAQTPADTGPDPFDLQDFGLVSPTEGWALVGQHLYWTETGGQQWLDITPPKLGVSFIRTVSFLDAQHGWLLLTNTDRAGFSTFAVARTLDSGQTWQTTPLSLFQPGDPNALVETVHFHFIDSSTGWLVIKRATSSNFSVGALFKTTDGGQTWTQLTLPIGEPVYFITGEVGWTAGGAAGDALYRTQDGGLTWSRQSLPHPSAQPWPRRRYRLPIFENKQEGVLPVVLADSDHSQVEFYVTHDGGQIWQLETSTSIEQALDPQATLPLTVWGVGRWLMIVPNSNRILSLAPNNRVAAVVSPDHLTANISELEMATPHVGWARYSTGRCTSSPANIRHCTSETRLLRTDDGGQSWVMLTLPRNGDLISESSGNSSQSPGNGAISGQALGSETQTLIGQGFDKCEIASLSQLQNWIVNSPYRAVNLYIGGSNRGCPNAALTASFVNQLKQQGWKLIPTWVGPQAACLGYASQISDDPTIAYNQGLAEANAAIEVASNLGLTLADQSGTIIYFDLEYYDYTNTDCHHEAARAFISGWTGQLRARNTQAGVYGHGPILNSFASLSNVPDAIWPAHWFLPFTFKPDATVWDVYGLSNSLWNNHQRIRQYAGSHDETWGGVELNIDSNVIDGIVAPGPSSRVFLPLIIVE